jgi:hypothetical protein
MQGSHEASVRRPFPKARLSVTRFQLKQSMVLVCLGTIAAGWLLSNSAVDQSREDPAVTPVLPVQSGEVLSRNSIAPNSASTIHPEPTDWSALASGSIARSSSFYTALPAEDQQWILDETQAALARGQISPDQLFDFIDQLSSVRSFAVLERKESYHP